VIEEKDANPGAWNAVGGVPVERGEAISWRIDIGDFPRVRRVPIEEMDTIDP